MTEYLKQRVQGWGFQRDVSSDLDDFCCLTCRLDYQIDARDCGADGRAIVLTRWWDLEGGLDRKDPQWKMYNRCLLLGEVALVRGSGRVRRCFEASGEEEGSDGTTERNEKYLQGKQYKTKMYPTRSWRWLTPGDG